MHDISLSEAILYTMKEFYIHAKIFKKFLFLALILVFAHITCTVKILKFDPILGTNIESTFKY